MDGNLLQEVHPNEIPQILQAWKKKYPENFIQCQAIENMEKSIKENVQNPKQNLYRCGDLENGLYIHLLLYDIGPDCLVDKVYAILNPCPSGGGAAAEDAERWGCHGIVDLPCPNHLGEVNYYWIQPFTPDPKDASTLTRVLHESKVIPWNESNIVFAFVPVEFTPVIFQASLAKEVDLLDIRCHFDVFMLPPNASIDFGGIPPELTLEFLDFIHGAVMNSTWSYKGQGTDIYLGLQIQNNFGLGIFTKSDKKLVCSALSSHFGGIFVLHTDPEFRNKGYAQLLVSHMVRVIRERNQVPFSTIDNRNIASHKLFNKMGFKKLRQVDYIHKL